MGDGDGDDLNMGDVTQEDDDDVKFSAHVDTFTVEISVPFYAVALYNYYHGIIDHSGINFKGQWWQPWQPDAEFHDEHHQFFHCNYGFNMSIWDKVCYL